MLLDSSKEILAGIAALFRDESTSDVTLYIGEERTALRAHRIVLSLHSDFFKAMLYSDLQEGISHEVDMPEAPSEVLPVIEYMYTNRIELDPENTISILGVAHKYQVKSLCQQIVADLHREITTTDSAFQILQIADYYQLKQLEKSALRYIHSSFASVVRSDAFLKLEVPTVVKLLDDEELFAAEISIYEAVDRYIRNNGIKDEEKRRRLLCCVRLPYIPLREMLTVVRPSGHFSEQQIYDALEYQANPQGSSCIFTPRRFGGASDTEQLVFGKQEGKIAFVSDQEPNRNAENLRDGSNDGWVTYTNGDAHVVLELSGVSMVTRIKMKNYCSKKYSLWYKHYGDDAEWKQIKGDQWESVEWHKEFDVEISNEEPLVTREIKLMVSDGNYTSWKMINVFGHKMCV